MPSSCEIVLRRFFERVWSGKDSDACIIHPLHIIQNAMDEFDDGLLEIIVALVAPTSKHIEDVGIMYDHAKKRHILAHDLLFANDVDPKSGKHDPLDFRRFVVIWKNRDDPEAVKYLVTNRMFWNGEKICGSYCSHLRVALLPMKAYRYR